MKKPPWKIVVALLISEIITGCGTISSLNLLNPYNVEGKMSARALYFSEIKFRCKEPTESIKIPHIYSGTMARYLSIPWMSNCGWEGGELGDLNNATTFILSPLLVTDLAVSFALDTVLLPITIPLQYYNGNIVDPPYFELGNIAERQNKYSKARDYYENGIQVLPKYFGGKPLYELASGFNSLDIEHALSYLAKYYSDNNDYSKSISYYNILIESKNHSKTESPAFYYREVADVYRKMGNTTLFNEYNSKSYNIEELPQIKQFIESLSKGRYEEREFSSMLVQKRIDVALFFDEAGDKNSELSKILADNNVVIEKKVPGKLILPSKSTGEAGIGVAYTVDSTPFYYMITKK